MFDIRQRVVSQNSDEGKKSGVTEATVGHRNRRQRCRLIQSPRDLLQHRRVQLWAVKLKFPQIRVRQSADKFVDVVVGDDGAAEIELRTDGLTVVSDRQAFQLIQVFQNDIERDVIAVLVVRFRRRFQVANSQLIYERAAEFDQRFHVLDTVFGRFKVLQRLRQKLFDVNLDPKLSPGRVVEQVGPFGFEHSLPESVVFDVVAQLRQWQIFNAQDVGKQTAILANDYVGEQRKRCPVVADCFNAKLYQWFWIVQIPI